jgi:hypothetical protein
MSQPARHLGQERLVSVVETAGEAPRGGITAEQWDAWPGTARRGGQLAGSSNNIHRATYVPDIQEDQKCERKLFFGSDL